MIEKVIITRDELCDLVASVLQYNKKTATEFKFVTFDGDVMMTDFVCEIACEAAPIKVRVTPDDDETKGILFTEMDKAQRMFDEWRRKPGNRPQTNQAIG